MSSGINHSTSTFKNSCLKLPINPHSKLPAPSFEQEIRSSKFNEFSNNSIIRSTAQSPLRIRRRNNSATSTTKSKDYGALNIESKFSKGEKRATIAVLPDNTKTESFSDFLYSIPDYTDIHHLSNKEFYEKLNNLKLKQRKLFYNIQHDEIPEKLHSSIDLKHISKHQSKSDKSWFNKNGKDVDSTNSTYDCDISTATPTPTPSFQSGGVGGGDENIHPKPSASPTKRTVRIDKNSIRNTPDSDTDTFDYCFEQRQSQPKLSPNNEHPILKKSNSRINSAKSKFNSSSTFTCSPIDSNLEEYCNKIDNLSESEIDFGPSPVASNSRQFLCTRSAPTSPVKSKNTVGWKDAAGKITIPKPFKMTVKDEEEKIVNDLISSLNDINNSEETKNDIKSKMFRAHPVPIESRIPLFDKITADQERRREITKLNRKIALQSQIRPFSFTKREEELKEISKLFSKSSPQLMNICSKDHNVVKTKPFKANPIPKNLFSNYFYQKMREDEYYRNLKKRIRAEEMMKASTLPPSMAARQKEYRKALQALNDIHYFDKFDCSDNHSCSDDTNEHEHNCCSLNHNYYHCLMDRHYNSNNKGKKPSNLCKYKHSSSSAGNRPFKRNKRSESRTQCSRSHFDNEISSTPTTLINTNRASSANELHSVNRSNLAAILRIESARKRFELEMQHQLQEQQRRDEARWRAKIIHRKDAWQSLKYDHDEELAMRLQMRKDEERMRQEEYRHQMELMLGRVQQMPYLFERSYSYQPRKNKNILRSESYPQEKQDNYDDSLNNTAREVEVAQNVARLNQDIEKLESIEKYEKERNSDENIDTPKIVINDNNSQE